MSLPEELLDELLSAHLDDALSDDERRRVEQMLRDDSSINDRMEQLRSQRREIRNSLVPVPELPEGFADRVVQAAMERAEREGLNEEHPLRLAARNRDSSSPALGSPDSNGWYSTRAIAVVATLAASLLLALSLADRSGDPDSQNSDPGRLMVEADPQQPERNPADQIETPDEIESPAIVDDQPMLADTGAAAQDVPRDRGDVAPPAEENNAVSVVADSSAMVVAADQPSPRPKEIASPISPLNMLMVIEVKRSEAGRLSGSFAQALAKAQIEIGNEREIDENLARAVADRDESESFVGNVEQVVLLESPAKKLDLLVNHLASDREGVEAIGFSAITAQFDAPLLRSIESVRTVDPTQIRHLGVSIPIVSHSGDVFQKWSGQLGDRPFAPLQSREDAEIVRTMMSATDNGPDQMANILFLVR